MTGYTIRTRYIQMDGCAVVRKQYEDGSLALIADNGVDEDGFPDVETLSVNLSGYGLTPPEGHIYVRDYAEAEGLPDALEDAGIATKVEEVPIGYARGYLMKLAEGV